MSKNREIVTLCGSTKYKKIFEEYNKIFTMQGKIVLMPGCFAHFDNIELTVQEKHDLDELHKDKILKSDFIFVINKDLYIGDSTRSEIDYAILNNIKIIYLENIN